MPDLKSLQQELEQALNKRKSLHEKEPDGLSPDALTEEQGLHDRAMKLHVLIEQAQAEAREDDFVKLTRFMNDPLYKVPRPMNNDADGRKALQEAGWEIKDGKIVYHSPVLKSAPPLEFVSEEVLYGPIPDEPFAAQYFRQMRGIMQPAYRKAYARWFRLCGQLRDQEAAKGALDPTEFKALSEGTDSAGGFLVPPDVQAEMLVRAGQLAIMRRLGRVVNTSRDRIVFPRVNPHATSGSIYTSGFVGGFTGETPAFSETDPSFGTFEISIKKLRVATKLSNDFIADAASNVLAFLAENGAQNMALAEDNGFITGDGTALQPLGFLNDAAVSTVDVEGSTADTISNTSAAAGSTPKIINLVYALPSQYAQNAQFLMRRAIEGKVRGLVDGAGRPVWPAMTGSGFAPAPREILGIPVNNSEFMPAEGTNGNKVLAVGDFTAYIIAQRAQISTTILRERFADTDQTGIIIWERVGGALWNNDAIRFGIV